MTGHLVRAYADRCVVKSRPYEMVIPISSHPLVKTLVPPRGTRSNCPVGPKLNWLDGMAPEYLPKGSHGERLLKGAIMARAVWIEVAGLSLRFLGYCEALHTTRVPTVCVDGMSVSSSNR